IWYCDRKYSIYLMAMGSEEPLSIDVVRRSDLFPPVILVSDDPNLQVPFPCLVGEQPRYIGRSAEGVITITNFRINVCQRKSFVNIPLRLVESVEIRDIFYLVLFCKDATTVRCLFSTNEDCQQWYKRVIETTATPKDLGAIFAFVFYAKSCEHPALVSPTQESSSASESAAQLCAPLDESQAYSFGKDVERMKFDISNKKAWRILQINDNYSVCRSYPRLHIVPQCISDETMKNVASFRSSNRFPSIVWRDQRNGAVIVRCSQPELGWLGWRNYEDEALCRSIPETCARDPGTLGLEEKRDYYTNCDIQFMNLPNIHTIRKSFQSLRILCSTYPDHANWLSGLEACKWLQYVGAIIRVTLTVVTAIDVEAKPVLIHCSDGWDRTPQVSALAQLLLDPFYRTIQGFQWLVEREWLAFGHKFADRCGHTVAADDPNERAPVFLQWLDCVFQVTQQFPCAFQFNEAFLVKLVQHSHSCLFGTFLFNTICEQECETSTNPTASVWSLLHPRNPKFLNPLYCPTQDKHVLYPEYGMHRLQLWSSVYLSSNSLQTSTADDFGATLEQVQTPDKETTLPRTRSCEILNLAACASDPTSALGRRLSDPNVACGEHLALLNKEVDSSETKYLDDISPLSNDLDNTKKTDNSEQGYTVDCSTASADNTELSRSSSTADVSDVISAPLPEVLDVAQKMNGLAWGFPLLAEREVSREDMIADHDAECDSSMCKDEKLHKLYFGSCVFNGDPEKLSHLACQGEACGNVQETLDPLAEQDNIYNSVPGLSAEASSENIAIEGPELHENVADTADVAEILPAAITDCLADGLPAATSNRSVESSTDTLTGEVMEDVIVLKTRLCHKDNLFCMNQNGLLLLKEADSEKEQGLREARRGVQGKVDFSLPSLPLQEQKVEMGLQALHLLQQKSSSMSTSTTDISDSSISSAVCPASGLGLHVRLSCSGGVCGMGVAGKHTPTSSEVSLSGSSLGPTPVNSCTPTSTSSPMAVTDSKLNGIGRHLDCDGLTRFVDPIIERVQQMEMAYQQRIADLEMQLGVMRQNLLQLAPCCNGAGRAIIDPSDLQGFLHESPDGGEMSSLGTVSNPASDVSWEQVDERDSKITLWVPDHVVTHCASCDCPFWLGRRKHHCRNCGKVYCGPCSNYFAPVPAQHLVEPVRLCHRCYGSLHHQGPGAASDDSRIAAIVVAE
ncbi:hypothetical protein C0Q70_08538, partial [Pomacea canaliculata]